MAKKTIAAASFAAGSGGGIGSSVSGKTIERAMSLAAAEALAAGITDADAQRKLMLAARERVKAHAKANAIVDEDERGKAPKKADKAYGDLLAKHMPSK